MRFLLTSAGIKNPSVMAPSIGEFFVGWKPPTGGDRTLGMVDSSMFPHLDHEWKLFTANESR